MKKLYKGLGMGLVTSALVLGMGAVNAFAATTFAVNAITETGALTVTAAGALGFVTGTNAINLGADAAAKTITIGNVTGATAVNINAGTGASTFAVTGAGTLTLGGVAATGNVTYYGAVSGGANALFSNTTTAATAVLGAQTSGTFTLGGSAATGAITIGSSTGIQAINIGIGGTGAKTITIGDGASTGATTIKAGSGGIILQGTVAANNSVLSSSATGGVGYATGAGCAVTQITSRTTGVTCTGVSGAITLVSAAGQATPQSFTVTDSSVAALDTIIINQKSGTDLYSIFVTNVGAGSFKVTYFNSSGTTTEQPVFNFAVLKAVAS